MKYLTIKVPSIVRGGGGGGGGGRGGGGGGHRPGVTVMRIDRSPRFRLQKLKAYIAKVFLIN